MRNDPTGSRDGIEARSVRRLRDMASWMSRDVLTTSISVVSVSGLLFGIAFLIVNPMPPGRIVIATGLEDSVYQHFAEQYKAVLARDHVELEIRRSAGSMQNLHDLSTGAEDADVAFIQSGTSNDNASSRRRLVSLGSLFVEPVWLFYRSAALKALHGNASAAVITHLDQLRGLRLNVGTMGSGGPRLARQLLEVNGLSPQDVALTVLDDATAAAMLAEGSLDAAMFVTAPDSPLVQNLLQASGIRLASFEEAEAYSRRFPFLKHVVLPKGIVSFAKGIPTEDIHLIAPTATLVARNDLHPAAVELLMQAVTQVHGGASWFGRAGEFPNDQYTEVRVSPVAERYYRSGPLFLQRYLPFWLASVLERMGVLIVPVIALIIPLSRILPPLYTWQMRSRIYRWYGELRTIEKVIARDASNVAADERDTTRRNARCLDRLASIQERVDRIAVPLAFANELYTLKMHIEGVRAGLVLATRA